MVLNWLEQQHQKCQMIVSKKKWHLLYLIINSLAIDYLILHSMHVTTGALFEHFEQLLPGQM